jgi:hypothetical protein
MLATVSFGKVQWNRQTMRSIVRPFGAVSTKEHELVSLCGA